MIHLTQVQKEFKEIFHQSDQDRLANSMIERIQDEYTTGSIITTTPEQGRIVPEDTVAVTIMDTSIMEIDLTMKVEEEDMMVDMLEAMEMTGMKEAIAHHPEGTLALVEGITEDTVHRPIMDLIDLMIMDTVDTIMIQEGEDIEEGVDMKQVLENIME